VSLRRAVSLVAAGCLAATSFAAIAPAAGAGGRVLPSKDPFYRYSGSKPLRDIKAGTVLKRRTVDVALGGNTTPVTAEQLLYRTTNERRKPAVTVTTVLLPQGAPAPTRIVAYLSFYDALGSECDPSYTLAGGNPGSANEQQAEEEEALIASYLTTGAAITVPDFEGNHLDWAAGQESGYSTLDALRATESYLGVARSTPVGLTGYSGGSIAAEWASELQHRYAPKLHLVGVAEGGIPVDFAHNLHYVNGSASWSGVIPAVMVSLTRAFHKKLHRYLSAYGRKVTKQVRHECIGSFVGNYPGLRVQRLLKHKYRDFVQVPEFRHIINHLIMGRVKGRPKMPLFMAVGNADGTGDGVMVTKDVEGLAHEYCTQGSTVQFTTYSDSDHDQAALQFEPAAVSFLQQRFDGVPFSGNCSSVGKGNSLKPVKAKHKHHHHKKH
jgi:hypothetical protein